MIPQFSNCWNHSNWHSFTCPSFTAVLPSAIFSLSREPGKRKLGWSWDVSLAPLWRVQATWHCSLIPWTCNALQVSSWQVYSSGPTLTVSAMWRTHLRSKMPCWESFFQMGYRKCKTNCLCGLGGWKKNRSCSKKIFYSEGLSYLWMDISSWRKWEHWKPQWSDSIMGVWEAGLWILLLRFFCKWKFIQAFK